MEWDTACALCAMDAPNRVKRHWVARGENPPFTLKARGFSDLLRSRGIGILVIGEEKYPSLLSELPDPPCFLLHRGSVPSLPLVTVAGPLFGNARTRREEKHLAHLLVGQGCALVCGVVSRSDRRLLDAVLSLGGYGVAVTEDILRPFPCRRNLAVLSPFFPGEDRSWHSTLSLWNVLVGLSRITVLIQPPSGGVLSRLASEALDVGRDVFLFTVDGTILEGGIRLVDEGCPVFPHPLKVW